MTTPVMMESMEVQVDPVLTMQLPGWSETEEGVGEAVSMAFARLEGYMARHGIHPSGPPRTVYTAWGPEGTRFIAAMPIAEAPEKSIPIDGGVRLGAMGGARAIRFVHHGPYRELHSTYHRIEEWLRDRGVHMPQDWANYSPMWEEYVNDPVRTPESDLVTRIYLTLR